VVTLNIVKRAGENLISAAGKIKDITAEMQANEELPKDLKVLSQAIRVRLPPLHLMNWSIQLSLALCWY
jgi:hypothetical protein